MRKTLLLPLCALLCCCTAKAQPDYFTDSLRVVQAEWRTDTLDGFLLRSYHFGEGSLFCSAQHLFLIELPPGTPRRLAFVHDSTPTPVPQLSERAGALAAVNGTFFDMGGDGSPVCYLRVDGHTVGENTPQASDSINRKYYQYATIALDDSSRLHLLVPDSSRHWEDGLSHPNVMTAGPMLLRGGEYVPQRDDRTFVTSRHSRTALGLRPDGTVLLMAADARFRHVAEGLSLPELARIMRWLGCSDAINLDGGGSTTMYVRGKKDGGVVNYPSDNGRHDHDGARPVSNAIIVR